MRLTIVTLSAMCLATPVTATLSTSVHVGQRSRACHFEDDADGMYELLQTGDSNGAANFSSEFGCIWIEAGTPGQLERKGKRSMCVLPVGHPHCVWLPNNSLSD